MQNFTRIRAGRHRHPRSTGSVLVSAPDPQGSSPSTRVSSIVLKKTSFSVLRLTVTRGKVLHFGHSLGRKVRSRISCPAHPPRIPRAVPPLSTASASATASPLPEPLNRTSKSLLTISKHYFFINSLKRSFSRNQLL